LRPGVAGRTETVKVRSIIGRFLEHSRIFHFANGHEDPVAGEFLIGSADWMYRNLSKRVEVITPVLAPNRKARLWEILDICLRDQRQAWMLSSDGTYSRLRPDGKPEDPVAIGTHQKLMDLTRLRATAH
jgi:polyphosphate kinase